MKHVFSIFMLFLCSSCLDQVDKYYPDYDSLISDNFEKTGWIHEIVLPSSTTHLYSRMNLDINSFMISYKVNSQDLPIILSKLDTTNQVFVKPHGLSMPKWWFKNEYLVDIYKLRGDSSKVFLAIDKEHNTIYYWGQLK